MGTIDSHFVTPSLHGLLQQVLECAVHKRGQGYWIKAEYGAGKTHFLAALTTLLTSRDEAVWAALHDPALRRDYQGVLGSCPFLPLLSSPEQRCSGWKRSLPAPSIYDLVAHDLTQRRCGLGRAYR